MEGYDCSRHCGKRDNNFCCNKTGAAREVALRSLAFGYLHESPWITLSCIPRGWLGLPCWEVDFARSGSILWPTDCLIPSTSYTSPLMRWLCSVSILIAFSLKVMTLASRSSTRDPMDLFNRAIVRWLSIWWLHKKVSGELPLQVSEVYYLNHFFTHGRQLFSKSNDFPACYKPCSFPHLIDTARNIYLGIFVPG